MLGHTQPHSRFKASLQEEEPNYLLANASVILDGNLVKSNWEIVKYFCNH